MAAIKQRLAAGDTADDLFAELDKLQKGKPAAGPAIKVEGPQETATAKPGSDQTGVAPEGQRPFKTPEEAQAAKGQYVHAVTADGKDIYGRIYSTNAQLVRISQSSGEGAVWVRPHEIREVIPKPAPGEGTEGQRSARGAPGATIPDIVVEPSTEERKAALTTSQAPKQDIVIEGPGGEETTLGGEPTKAAGPNVAQIVSKQRKGAPGELRSIGQQLADIVEKGKPGESRFGAIENPPPVYAWVDGRWTRGFATGEESMGKFRVRLENGTHEWLPKNLLAPGGKGPPKGNPS